MKNLSRIKITGILLFFLIQYPIAMAQNLRQLTVSDGLNGSFVNCLHQSKDGFLWFGTKDGLNTYSGQKVEEAAMLNLGSLEGYEIKSIVETMCDNVWIQTAYGLHKLSRLTRETVSYPQFTGKYMLRVVGKDQVIVCDKKNRLYLYQPTNNCFIDVEFPLIKDEVIKNLGGSEEFCWIENEKGLYRFSWQHQSKNSIQLGQAIQLMEGPINYMQSNPYSDDIYVVDTENHLYQINIRENKKTYVLQLKADNHQAQHISSIVKSHETYYISYESGGIHKYTSTGSRWEKEDLNVKSGVTQMIKDIHQDLIWIATDGQGVFAYWNAEYNIHSFTYSEVNRRLVKPICSLYMDNKGWLWLGTKGEGILGIDRSDKSRNVLDSPQRLLTSKNSLLAGNTVQALSASVHNGFWIGSEEGLNFYHYNTQTIQDVIGGKEIKDIHSIIEFNDSVLCITTIGNGAYKANIERSGSTLRLTHFRHFDMEESGPSSNNFFVMHYTSGGDLWLGNRGQGVFQIYPFGAKPIVTPNRHLSQLQHEILSLYEHKDVFWTGTSHGLYGLSKDGKEWYLDKKNGLPNNNIQSLQVDGQGALWIATNNGIARLDPTLKEINTFDKREGLNVTEFCNGASFKSNGTLYFGAVNGWVEISNNVNYKSSDEYTPPLFYSKLKGIEGKEVFLHLLMMNTPEGEIPEIELACDENAFSISFMVMDYVNAGDYHYFYKVDSKQHGTWIDNGKLNTLSFAQMQPGDYTLQVKYSNSTTGYESEPISFRIHINPYWWQSPWMIALYWLILLSGILFLVWVRYRRSQRRHVYEMKELEQRHKEEVYEEKLRFFTNITHEFSTPLTLIYGPCERILSYKGTDEFIYKYVTLIKRHTERLYQLIQEIIDYRRIETKHQQLNLVQYNLSEYIQDACSAYMDLAEKNSIHLTLEIEADVLWNMDRRCFPKILNNLLSNAFKYTPQNGNVKVSFCKLSEDEVELKVYNTGKGIKEEDRSRIFNRYHVLDEVTENTSHLFSKNGLGMAICHSTVQLLGGTITINSEVGQYAEFVVTLPLLPITEENKADVSSDVVPLSIQNLETKEEEMPEEDNEGPTKGKAAYVTLPSTERSVILVVDDNKDVLFMLREFLSLSFEVYTALNAEEAWGIIRTVVPHLIITDVMMPGIDGITFAKQIKQNKYTMHIPLVILSAKNTDAAKTEGVKAGADAYIGKPFNFQYLSAVVTRLIESHKSVKEYYSTSASAYSYVEGQLIKSEDKDFLYKLNEIIEQNLNNSSLSNTTIAEMMHLSPRTLYRRLKELQLPSPKDYLKDYKMNKAEKLLQTTSISVQEIIFECGYNNRALFYKDFTERHGMTPKEFRNQKKDAKDL